MASVHLRPQSHYGVTPGILPLALRVSLRLFKIIACIEGSVVIEEILTHLDKKSTSIEASRLPPCRGHATGGIVRLTPRKPPDHYDRLRAWRKWHSRSPPDGWNRGEIAPACVDPTGAAMGFRPKSC